MKGRIENQQAVKRKTVEKLDNAPIIVKNYYRRLTQCRSELTKRQYVNHVLSFIDFIGGDKKIPTVTANTLAEYQDHIYNEHLKKTGEELKAASIKTRMSSLNSFFKFCIKEGVLRSNPMDMYDLPLIPDRDKVVVAMDAREIETVMAAIKNGVGSDKAIDRQARWKTRDKAIIHLALATALRVEAIIEINIEDIDFYKAELRVIEKRARERVIYLGHDTIDCLKIWIRDRKEMIGNTKVDALFVTKYGGTYKRITSRAVEKIVAKYTSSLDKKITPHKLRSTAGNRLYEDTGDIYAVADLLGHSNISTSQYYAANSERKKKEIAQKLAQAATGKT